MGSVIPKYQIEKLYKYKDCYNLVTFAGKSVSNPIKL
mgnify:CR=1 FL=1